MYAPNYCNHCKHWKPPRAHHCGVCQRCTLRMDHHCPFTGNCIGSPRRELAQREGPGGVPTLERPQLVKRRGRQRSVFRNFASTSAHGDWMPRTVS